jgi:hypothetical protein
MFISQKTQHISIMKTDNGVTLNISTDLYVKCLLFLFDFDQKRNVSTDFSKIEISRRSSQCESRSSMLQTDEQMGGRT